jgi:hypothetical protein
MRCHARYLFCAAAAVLAASALTSPAQAQQPEQRVECVARTATAAPPPSPPGPQRAGSEKGRAGEKQKTEPAMQPVCPEGQVPRIEEKLIERQVPQKGNPLLRPLPGAKGPALAPGRAVSPGDVRSFREIYGSDRTKRTGGTPSAPTGSAPPSPTGGAPPAPGGGPSPAPAGPLACAGVPSFGSCYYYGTAGLSRTADGGGMTASVNRPAYDNSGGAGHTLDEIAVQGGAKNGNIVELGWLVSSDQNGDNDPHIFVFHWKGWNPTCYNGCGWQQYSNTYFPGQNINALSGRELYIGYVFYKRNWWAWFDNQWLGYFPGTEWNNSYTKSALLQWFGEVASQNGVPPKTQMGDGVLPPAASAAHMFTLCDVDAKAWICWYRDQQSLIATAPNYYDIQRVAFGDTRYGGPGQ